MGPPMGQKPRISSDPRTLRNTQGLRITRRVGVLKFGLKGHSRRLAGAPIGRSTYKLDQIKVDSRGVGQGGHRGPAGLGFRPSMTIYGTIHY